MTEDELRRAEEIRNRRAAARAAEDAAVRYVTC